MNGVDEVRQLDDTHLHWVAEIGGHREEWDAEITEQSPDERIAWKATAGKKQRWRCDVPSLGGSALQDHAPARFGVGRPDREAGSAIGQDDRQVKGDLERFKELVESRGAETGAWRGEVERGTHNANR